MRTLEHAGERDFAELAPSFLWLLRDFHLSLVNEQGAKVGLPRVV